MRMHRLKDNGPFITFIDLSKLTSVSLHKSKYEITYVFADDNYHVEKYDSLEEAEERLTAINLILEGIK